MVDEKVMISVIRKFHPKEVFGDEYQKFSGKVTKECTNFKIGEKILIEHGQIPEGFCVWAWRDIYKDLSVLRFGGKFNHPEPGVIYTSSSDGRKPVVFKLERL